MKNSNPSNNLVTLSTADLVDHSATQCRIASTIAATINYIGSNHPRILLRYASETLAAMTTNHTVNVCAVRLLKIAILRCTSHTYTGEFHKKTSIDHLPGQLSLISTLD